MEKYMKQILAVMLVFQIFSLSLPVAPGISYCYSRGLAAAEKVKTEGKKTRGENENGSIKEVICPFKYLVYFLWYSFVVIGGAVVLVADISFGFAKKLTKKYVRKVDKRTKKIEVFFNRFGCAE